MARYYFGQIYLAYVNDGAGHTKEHPVLIIDPDEGCASGEAIQVVVISTKIENPCPDHHVRVHHDRNYDRFTGLSEPCVAKCNWAPSVEPRRFIKFLGSMPDDLLDSIIDKVNELLDDPSFDGWVDRE
ncbi:type II toxin-antitoxin system PemK/MazF family toxin [Tundrisphaera lichenicola]|uniref:type II toxin-antitoxin system PemK/MazF family toxin n=1 Tax=Tundrisphaera lichenicola TaxID=2029860 RepID=UPI003EC0EF78